MDCLSPENGVAAAEKSVTGLGSGTDQGTDSGAGEEGNTAEGEVLSLGLLDQ
ncbi:MAG: hypothetical protein ABI980_15980 [Nitrospirota bacterium]